MVRFLPGLVALFALVGTGVVHGLQSDRWDDGTDLKAAAARLELVPKSFGDWDSEPQEIPRSQLEQAGAVGYVGRHYVNRVNGNRVNVVILCGRHGPMSVHAPTVCFEGAGWKLTDIKKRTVDSVSGTPSAECWQGDFEQDSAGIKVRIRTLWAWGSSGTWTASDNPRREFAGSKHLYKLYVTVNTTERSETSTATPAGDFLKVYLPHLQASFNPKSKA